MNNYFYDTCSLLTIGKDLFNEEKNIFISSITIAELENIKTSASKDQETKFLARQIINMLENNTDKYEIVLYKTNMSDIYKDLSLELTNDLKILACAYNLSQEKDLYFITNDLVLKQFAQIFFPTDHIVSIGKPQTKYTGFKEVVLDENELIKFYQDPFQNYYNLLINQYLIIQDSEKKVVDLVRWDGQTHQRLNYKTLNSKWFGDIKPYKNDIYQKLAFDSLQNNQLTVLRGPAGVGKSWIGFGYLFSLLENSKINKIYIFCNPVATKDSAKLGFYPGDKNTKLLDSQIGNFLISKIGDLTYVEQLISKGDIVLVPLADCRGMDISDNCGIYITEAQNSTVALMKLMVQRIGINAKCVIEGDDFAQTDLGIYEGQNNGLRRLSQVFRGESYYGEVTLKNCYRSAIATKAQEM